MHFSLNYVYQPFLLFRHCWLDDRKGIYSLWKSRDSNPQKFYTNDQQGSRLNLE